SISIRCADCQVLSRHPSLLFFFSSRRRHTRFSRDWSSDVCSSDLALNKLMQNRTSFVIAHRLSTVRNASQILVLDKGTIAEAGRSEERRVGKECRHRWPAERHKGKSTLMSQRRVSAAGPHRQREVE